MSKTILIDGACSKFVKFVILDQRNKLKDFFYKNIDQKLAKGNIYIGKINRIEKSLRAVFVSYGGNKKGFLPFEMIHPKYYQSPIINVQKSKNQAYGKCINKCDWSHNKIVDNLFNNIFYSNKSIKNTLRRNQIILIQIAKEERPRKGAFLTTYLTLTGKHCTFLPNSFKNNLSMLKKLHNDDEIKRLKFISRQLLKNYNESDLKIENKSTCKSKLDIKKDFQHINEIWQKIKNCTKSSSVSSLVYEEKYVFINEIRNHFAGKIKKITVLGKCIYKQIKELLFFFTPCSIQKLKKYKSAHSMFHEHNIEEKINKLYSHNVKLQSGGYIVINDTEALISIDINSGAYTMESNIENTALVINLEAVLEIAKQVKFRELSGLIVIDFIDMPGSKNKKLIEKQLKKIFWHDKMKVQIGKISEFGLLEMSRKRIGKNFIEINDKICSTCCGKGKNISINKIIKLLIDKLKFLIYKKKIFEIDVIGSITIIEYLINKVRYELKYIEKSYSVKINLIIEKSLLAENYRIVLHKSRNLLHVTSDVPASLKNFLIKKYNN